MKKVAIVILNWNGEKFLKDFLPSVITHSQGNDIELIIADNASTDHSIAYLEENHPNIRIIRNKRNEGFAGGYNVALQQIDAEYYVLLNSDVEVSANWIEPIISMMDKNPEIAATQPKVMSWSNPSHFEYAGAAGGFIDKFGYPFCRGRIFQQLEKDKRQYETPAEIFWATGACMFVRSEAFHALGGFDADFFAHMEEIDLCWRFKNKGYKIYYHPQSVIYHVGGGTLPSSSSFKVYLNIRNNLAMLYKNLPKNKLAGILFIRLVLDGIAAIKFFLDGGINDVKAVVRAHHSFYKMIPKLKQKRSAIAPQPVTLTYKKSIVADHYLRGKKIFTDLNQKQFSK